MSSWDLFALLQYVMWVIFACEIIIIQMNPVNKSTFKLQSWIFYAYLSSTDNSSLRSYYIYDQTIHRNDLARDMFWVNLPEISYLKWNQYGVQTIKAVISYNAEYGTGLVHCQWIDDARLCHG